MARLRRLVIPVILTGLTACDNVSWGGVELRLEAPATTGAATADTVSEAPPPLPPLDVEPALFLVERTDSGAYMLPVALIGEGGLEALPPPGEIEEFDQRFLRERMQDDRSFVLFASGARAGTFHPEQEVGGGGRTTTSAVPAAPGAPAAEAPSREEAPGPFCRSRPAVEGRIEIVPEAVEHRRFLALAEDAVEGVPALPYVARASTRDQRVGALNAASALFVTREIRWPPSVLEARADLRVIGLPGREEESIVATFLYGDALQVGPAPPNAYSLFFIAEPGGSPGYEASYVRYREVGPDGKSVPLFVDHADWDGDGRQDALLEIFGESGRTFAALALGESGWSETFRDACGGGAAAGAEPEGASTSG